LNAMLRKKAGDYDVVNLYNFPSTWAAYGLKKPVVWMFDEPGDIRSNLRQSLVLKAMYGGGVSIDKYIINNFVDTICVADETNRERVLRRYGREPHLIPYGMDIGPSCPKKNEEMRHLFGLDGRFVVFHPGMISAQKNQLESLKAVWRLHEKIKDIVLVLTGVSHDGYRKTIEAFIKEKKIEKHVVFLGHLSEESSRHLYMASDVAVFPEQSAGGWLYPFEVISSGAPIVASKAFAASSLIGREKLGLVTDDLASAIEYIFLHPQKSRRTSERAFEWARRNFGWEHFTGQMVDVFDSVIH
ncbi:MAG: glycosyltransferase family 4 protein, partial [Thermodesulfobacteriota bacterium]